MATDQHQIIATPKDRWYLARFLLRDGLTYNTRTEQKILARAKRALGLDAPTDTIQNERKQGIVALAYDRTPSLFDVTPEIAEFFTRKLNGIEKPPVLAAEMTNLEPVLQQLEERSHAAEIVAAHPDAKPLDPKDEDWTPLAAPILQDPTKFVAVMADLLRRHRPDPRTEPAFAAFIDAFLEEAEVPKIPEGGAPKRGGRLLDPPPGPAPS
jgi:hypothetical protein